MSVSKTRLKPIEKRLNPIIPCLAFRAHSDKMEAPKVLGSHASCNSHGLSFGLAVFTVHGFPWQMFHGYGIYNSWGFHYIIIFTLIDA
jgi:hypothetical protein